MCLIVTNNLYPFLYLIEFLLFNNEIYNYMFLINLYLYLNSKKKFCALHALNRLYTIS